MPYAYQDGPVNAGTAQLTITPAGGGTGWTAVSDGEFTVERTTTRYEQTNALGEVAGAFGIKRPATGRTTIFLPAGKKASVGDTFTTDKTGTTVWIVTDETVVYSHDYTKQQLSFVEKLN